MSTRRIAPAPADAKPSAPSGPPRPRSPLKLAAPPALPGTALTDLTVSGFVNAREDNAPVPISGETLARLLYFLEKLDHKDWLNDARVFVPELELKGVQEVLWHLAHSPESVDEHAFDALSRFLGILRAQLIAGDTSREFLTKRYRLVAGKAEGRA